MDVVCRLLYIRVLVVIVVIVVARPMSSRSDEGSLAARCWGQGIDGDQALTGFSDYYSGGYAEGV